MEKVLEMSIEDWRIEIDEIDEQIIRLLNMRAKLAIKVGDLKMTKGLRIWDSEREQNVINQVLQANRGPLDEQAVTKIFKRIIMESRRIETQALNTNSPAI